ncbi:MAG: helix-turn-helix domain-containing protein [Anaerolineae bacterium]|nr:helix-turn-helix domain-containing protein [Anaerolineae bacterium]
MATQNSEQSLKNEVLTVKEVANYLRVSRVTIWRWCKQGVIPASQVGRSWRIRRDDLVQVLDDSRMDMDMA